MTPPFEYNMDHEMMAVPKHLEILRVSIFSNKKGSEGW